MEFGMINVVAITVIVYIAGQGIKATKLDNKWIPVICGGLGMLLGVAAMYLGVPDFPATDVLTAAAVGGASGLAATGVNQTVKQMKQ
jgi:ribonucleotide monophosphatase NagD (HAD superfamily)